MEDPYLCFRVTTGTTVSLNTLYLSGVAARFGS